jgi:methenyltetrahydrofolate cyclohydrolase
MLFTGKTLNHPASSSIFDLTLGEFLDRLGSSDPTPGGGAAAAVVGALGAALIEMTANLTIGRPRLADVQDQAHGIERRAADLRARLQKLGDADAEAFDQVTAAYKLPRADDAQKAARAQAIQAALRVAADVPLESARISAEVVELAEEAAPLLNPAVISDVLVGSLLAQAALNGAGLNVEINLASMTDATTVEQYSSELARAREGVDARVARILATGRSRFRH